MDVIIPLAGKGTRLRPHTYAKPKPMVYVGGKPVLGHIVDRVRKVNPNKWIFVYSHGLEEIKEYLNAEYADLNMIFVKQEEMKGDGHALQLAKSEVDINSPVLVDFSDTIFDDHALDNLQDLDTADAYVWVKKVVDYKRFGILTYDTNGRVSAWYEKPENLVGDRAWIGLAYFPLAKTLFEYLAKVVGSERTSKGGETRLADAFAQMLDEKKYLHAIDTKEWLDCGTISNLLETNKELLDKKECQQVPEGSIQQSVIIPPVFISKDAKIRNAIIGPYVSVASGVEIKGSVIKYSIIDQDAYIENMALEKSLIGKNALIRDNIRRLNVSDHSEIDFEH